MKKVKFLMIWIGLLLSLVSCKDAMEAMGIGGDEIPADGVTLTVQIPQYSEAKIRTRAGEQQEAISSLKAVFYGENNAYLRMGDCSALSQQSDGSYKVKVEDVPAATKNIHFVANGNDLKEDEASDLQALNKAQARVIDPAKPVCWGMVSVDTLLAGNASVALLRQHAKLTLTIDDAIAADFTNAGLDVMNTAAKAAIAPANYTEPTSEDLAESTDLSSGHIGNGTATEVTVNETSAGKVTVIIKAQYKKVEGYYKVALYKDDAKNSQYALLRNHHYTICVTKVNGYGFKTEEEAIKSEPENRLVAEIIDDNPEITNMIACKDYELGVSDYQEVSATTTEAIVTVVTSLKQPTSSDGKLYAVSIDADAQSWITSYAQTSESAIPESGNSSVGKKYTLRFTLSKNDESEKKRTGIITITSGDLSLALHVTQKGFDFLRGDDNRKVTLYHDNVKKTEDYLGWLDGNVSNQVHVYGISPREMQGVVRNNGLHFDVGDNKNYYLIPKLDGDQLSSSSDSRFYVSEASEGGKSYWKVTLNGDANNFNLWKSSFSIKNKIDATLTYEVYHMGIFQQITSVDYQMAEGGDDSKKVMGWFYYEVVKVQGQSKTYIMLDRNLGASNNGFYSPDVTSLKGNVGAIGGYFKISEGKNTSDATLGNLSSALSPSGYTIPEKDFFDDLVAAGCLEVVSQTTSYGETYHCVRIKTTGDSQLSYIYLPIGGYLEGESLKNPIHVNLWTKSLLSGNQGFSTTSPEYGYWYIYFDIYNKQVGLSNMRFVSGSNGNNNGRYKAMPIRLIASTTL